MALWEVSLTLSPKLYSFYRWRSAVKEIVFLVEESDEGGFTARALGVSIFTQADSMEALRNEVRDAVRCHFSEGGGPSVMRLQ